MKIEDIIIVLDSAKKLRNEVQEQLREYVNYQCIPLKERFRIWVTYCDKEDETFNFNLSNLFDPKQQVVRIHIDIDICDEKKEILIQKNYSHMIILCD